MGVIPPNSVDIHKELSIMGKGQCSDFNILLTFCKKGAYFIHISIYLSKVYMCPSMKPYLLFICHISKTLLVTCNI